MTSISKLIAPALDQYVELIKFDFEERPYLFGMNSDATRCMTSSQWSAYCKRIFQKWCGVACPPKMLRASFVVFVRNHEASPEILQQCARAMRHKKETADSDKCKCHALHLSRLRRSRACLRTQTTRSTTIG